MMQSNHRQSDSLCPSVPLCAWSKVNRLAFVAFAVISETQRMCGLAEEPAAQSAVPDKRRSISAFSQKQAVVPCAAVPTLQSVAC